MQELESKFVLFIFNKLQIYNLYIFYILNRIEDCRIKIIVV